MAKSKVKPAAKVAPKKAKPATKGKLQKKAMVK